MINGKIYHTNHFYLLQELSYLFDVLKTVMSRYDVTIWLLSLPLFVFPNTWVVVPSVKSFFLSRLIGISVSLPPLQ